MATQTTTTTQGDAANPKYHIEPSFELQGRIGRADPLRDRVGRRNGSFGPMLWKRHKNYLARLPQATDELSSELGIDVLDRMMNDPQISASIYTMVYQALSRELLPRPRYTDPNHPYYKASMEMYDFISYNLDFCNDVMSSMDGGMHGALEDLSVSRLVYGNSCTEWTGAVAKTGPIAGRLVLGSLKPKPPEVYAYVADAYGNTVGVACYTGEDSQYSPAIPTIFTAQNRWEIGVDQLPPGWEIVPIGKFLVTTHRPRFNDPRGNSALRSAYNAWYLLMNLWPDYHKYLVQFAAPSLKGTLGEKAVSRFNQETQATEDPLDELYALLEEFQNGSMIATRFGTEIEAIQANGDGTAFSRAIETLNHQMIKGIQHSILGTETSNNQTRAASTVHKDVQDLPAQSLKKGTADPFRDQVWKRLICLNFGQEAADFLTPSASLGSIAAEDKGPMLKSWASVGYKIQPSQHRYVANELEIDPPTQEELDLMTKAAENAANPPEPVGAAGAAGRPGGPTQHEKGDPDDSQEREEE